MGEPSLTPEPAAPPGTLRSILAGTGLILLGFLIGNGLNAGFQIVVARGLSTADVGRYFEATAVVGIALSVCIGGLRTGLVRFIAVLDEPDASALGLRVVGGAAVVSAVFAGALWLTSGFVSTRLFHDRGVVPLLHITSWALPLGAFGTLWAAAARGKGAFLYHFLGDQISLPAARLAVVTVGLALGAGVRIAAVAFVAGFGASAALGFVAAHRLKLLRPRRGAVGGQLIRNVLSFSAYRWGVEMLQIILLWADTLMLGAFYPPAIPGIYSIATRLVIFSSVGISALNLVVAPFVASRLSLNDPSEVSRIYAITSRWSMIVTVAPLALLLPVRRSILELFGHDFVAGSSALAALAIGYAVNAACGPCGVILTMSALNRLVLWDNVLALATNLALNLLLIPKWGMIGAALAWSTALLLVNGLMLVQLASNLRIKVFSPTQTKSVAALALVLAAAFLGGEMNPIFGVGLAVAGLPAATLLTAPPEEMAFLRSLWHSVRNRTAT